MNRKIMKGIITGGILGVTVAVYALCKRSHKIKKDKKKILNRASTIMKGFNMSSIGYYRYKYEV